MSKKWITLAIVSLMGVTAFAAEEGTSWADKIKMKGDMRLRHETIDQDGRDTRHRWRVSCSRWS